MNRSLVSIGELARRAGVAPSALRFYEGKGLISSSRSEGHQRQYSRDMLRRVAFIRTAQRLGIGLRDIGAALARLPDRRTPTQADWSTISMAWRPLLQAKIDDLTAIRDQLDACIGCGCLSLKKCKLYNPDDVASELGAGPRYLLGDRPGDARAVAQGGAGAGKRPQNNASQAKT